MILAVLTTVQIIIVIMLGIIFLVHVPEGDSIGSLGGGQFNNMKAMFAKRSQNTNPLSKVMFVLIALFMLNSLFLSGLYTKDVRQESVLYSDDQSDQTFSSIPRDGNDLQVEIPRESNNDSVATDLEIPTD